MCARVICYLTTVAFARISSSNVGETWDNRQHSQHTDTMHLSTICIAMAALGVSHGAEVDDSVTVPSGHLKPFGAHRPPEGDIDSLDAFPDPKTFYEKYVKVGRPVVFKGAAKGIPAFKRWTDEYLA